MPKADARKNRVPKSAADRHVAPRVGEEVDYFSRTYKCWSPTHITHVDMERGEITLHARSSPLKREEFEKRVRARLTPGKVQLEWIRSTMEGKVEKEAHQLFESFSDLVVEFDDQHGEVTCLDALSLAAMLDVGRALDDRLGASGNAYELKRRATQEMRRRGVELPAGWQEKRSSKGSVYYCRTDGTDSQLDWPSPDLALPQGIFNEVFWEALQSVYQRYSEALSPPKPSEIGADDYELGKQLGEGTFGRVYLARHKETGLQRAIKTIDRSGVQDDASKEIERMSQMDHPNIVRLYGHWKDDDAWHLVMDFCAGGDLSRMVSAHRREMEPIHGEHVKDIMRQILRAVTHMHGHGIMHLDLKPGNVVLMPDRGTLPPAGGPDRAKHWSQPLLTEAARPPHVMLIDFGLSRLFGPWSRYGPRAGTVLTMAPEVWEGIVTPPADVFSCGCILYNLMSFKYPYNVSGDTTTAALDFWARPPQPQPLPDRMPHGELGQQLCRSMLAVCRQDRPAASQCLEHGYLSQPQDDLSDGDGGRSPGADGGVVIDPKVASRMKKVASKDPLYRSLALRFASEWSANRLGSIKSAFEKFDKNNSGRLAVSQVEKVLLQLKFDPVDAKRSAAAMDYKKNGVVEWTEFVASCLHLGSCSMDQDLERMFKRADKDGDGRLGKRDLEQMFASDYLREQPVEGGVAEKLLNGRDGVTFPEFRKHFITANLDGDPDDAGSDARGPREPVAAGRRRSGVRTRRKSCEGACGP